VLVRPVRLIDATRVPCGASRETVKRSELAGWAHYGYCAAHSRWYWGLKLYLVTTPDGMPVAWCLADPKIGEREVAAALLAHAARVGALRPGLILVGDKGFAGNIVARVAGETLHLIGELPYGPHVGMRVGQAVPAPPWRRWAGR
jgi:hypothetical protein